MQNKLSRALISAEDSVEIINKKEVADTTMVLSNKKNKDKLVKKFIDKTKNNPVLLNWLSNGAGDVIKNIVWDENRNLSSDLAQLDSSDWSFSAESFLLLYSLASLSPENMSDLLDVNNPNFSGVDFNDHNAVLSMSKDILVYQRVSAYNRSSDLNISFDRWDDFVSVKSKYGTDVKMDFSMIGTKESVKFNLSAYEEERGKEIFDSIVSDDNLFRWDFSYEEGGIVVFEWKKYSLTWTSEDSDRVESVVTEKKEYLMVMEFVWKLDKNPSWNYKDAMKNLSMLLWDGFDSFEDDADIDLSGLDGKSVDSLYFDNWNILFGNKNILSGFDFSELPHDFLPYIFSQIKIILKSFVSIYPDSSKRLSHGWVWDVVKNIKFEENVRKLYDNLILPANKKKFENGSLDLSRVPQAELAKAMNYLVSSYSDAELSSIVLNWDVWNSLLNYLEKHKWDSWHGQIFAKLYYTFVKNNLWSLMENRADGVFNIDKLSIHIDKNYSWLMFWMKDWEKDVPDKLLLSYVKDNNGFPGIKPKQLNILMKTETGKSLLKQRIVEVESIKYRNASKPLNNAKKKFQFEQKKIEANKQKAEEFLSKNLGSRAWDEITNSGFYELSDDVKKYIFIRTLWTSWAISFDFNSRQYNMDMDDAFSPYQESWVDQMLKYHKIGVTKYLDYSLWTNGEKVNMAKVIDNWETIISPIWPQDSSATKLDFSRKTRNDIIRDAGGERFSDRFNGHIDDITEDPVYGGLNLFVDVGAVVASWVVGWVVSEFAGTAIASVVAVAVDRTFRWAGTGLLEWSFAKWDHVGLGWEDFGNFKDAFDAWWKYGTWQLETGVDAHWDMILIKDENWQLVKKSSEEFWKGVAVDFVATFAFMKASSLVIWKVESLVAPKLWKVGDKVMKSFSRFADAELHSNLSSQWAYFINSWLKTGVLASSMKYVFDIAGNLDMKNSLWSVDVSLDENSISELFPSSTSGSMDELMTMMAALNMSPDFISDPLLSEVVTTEQKEIFSSSKLKLNGLTTKLSSQMMSQWVLYLSDTQISSDPNMKSLLWSNIKSWFYKMWDGGVPVFIEDLGTEFPDIDTTMKQIDELVVEVKSNVLIPIEAKRIFLLKDEKISNYFAFLEKFDLNDNAFPPKLLIQQRIDACQSKIDLWENIDENNKILSLLNKQKWELIKLSLVYEEALQTYGV